MFRTRHQGAWPILAFALVLVLSPSLTAQPQPMFPDFVLVEPPFIQSVVTTENSMGAAKTNSVAFILRAQLVRQTKLDPPLSTEPLILKTPVSAAVSLERVAGPDFSQSCVMLAAAKAVQCTLTPNPGPTWGVAGPITMRLKLTAADGGTFTQFPTASVGQPPGVRVDWNISTRPGRPAASTTTEPLRLTAQLIRTVSPLPPGDAAIVPILSFALNAVGENAAPISPSCSLTPDSKTLNCNIAPSGSTWSGNPVIFRLEMVGQDSSLASALISQNITLGPGQVEVQLGCGRDALGRTGCHAGAPATIPLVLHLQVLRPGQAFGNGGDNDFMEIIDWQMGPVGDEPIGVSKNCSIAHRTLSCNLTPAGPLEWPAAFLHYNVSVKLADGSWVMRWVRWQL